MGHLVVTVKVLSSTILTPLISVAPLSTMPASSVPSMAYMAMPALKLSGLARHSSVNATSLEVTGVPSDQVAASCSLMVKVRLSSHTRDLQQRKATSALKRHLRARKFSKHL